MTEWLEPVSRTIEDIHALKSPGWEQENRLVYKEFALRRGAAIEFGRLNGWAVSQRVFGVQSIGRTQRRCDDDRLESWEDHRVWYCSDRPGRSLYTAIVGQPYGKIEY